MNFELWESDESGTLIEVPNRDRGAIIHEPNSKLVLRFKAESPAHANEIEERYYFHGNPDKLVSLNILGANFLFHEYKCGLVAGESVRFVRDFVVKSSGNFKQVYHRNLVASVLGGDIEAPQIVWLKVSKDPYYKDCEGQVISMPVTNDLFQFLTRVSG